VLFNLRETYGLYDLWQCRFMALFSNLTQADLTARAGTLSPFPARVSALAAEAGT
jgi:hypothetical protein